MTSFLALGFVGAVAAFLGVTHLLWHYERCRSRACRRGLSGADLGPLIAEAFALFAAVVSWPLGLIARSQTRVGDTRPVVLVHGWGLNPASMAMIGARLRRDGRAVYSPPLSWGASDLASAALVLAEQFRVIRDRCGAPVLDVVAYGAGGVLLRAAAHYHGVSSLLGNVVTLASPHRGSALAVLGLPAPINELRPGSPLLDDLVRAERFPFESRFTAIASPHDAIVFPFDLAYLPGAFNVTVDAVGHFSMLYSERVYTLIAENLDARQSVIAA